METCYRVHCKKGRSYAFHPVEQAKAQSGAYQAMMPSHDDCVGAMLESPSPASHQPETFMIADRSGRAIRASPLRIAEWPMIDIRPAPDQAAPSTLFLIND